MRFRFEWRSYQARVLAELDVHLEDNHFHLVAAPGSGKTLVGLEALRRVGKPALVFAPTIAIRDQWVRRFLEGYWSEARPPDWLSTELTRPGLLTVVTYQSLGAPEKRGEIGVLAKALAAAGVRTLVFDEAHHLRNQWWKSLDQVKSALESPFVIALTATPPYDVTQVEWNRYAHICGEVDEEISAPELVKARNLCPHQDFVYCCEPTEHERRTLERYRAGVERLLADIALNEPFVQALAQHPVLQRPADHVDALLADTDYFLGIAIFLAHATGVAPAALLEVLGLAAVQLPAFNRRWAEVLFTGLLFADRGSLRGHEEVLEQLQRDLVACGAIERRTVLLGGSAHNNRLLRSSASKLRAVADIVELESRSLDWRLRMLVLTDYIRAEDFPAPDGTEREVTKIGVVPLFEYLRKLRLPGVRLGVLTGKLAIIPATAQPALAAALAARGFTAAAFASRPLWHDPEYMLLDISAGGGGPVIELGTSLFTEGHINVLLGTAALLGEGWDAPAVNALVMATAIGSFVTSNQIRGRAIRVDPRDEFKTANIWHLACVEPAAAAEDPAVTVLLAEETDDWTLLERRFRAFVGLRHDAPVIENGIGRLGVARPTTGTLAASNARMCRDACSRERMADAWRSAIYHPAATNARVVREVFVPLARIPSHPVLRHWLRADGGWFGGWRRWLLERKVARVADALRVSLQDAGLMGAAHSRIVVSTGASHVLVRLLDVGCRDESVFVGALREIFDPLQSPRYLLVGREEEFAVPRVLADRRERAESFARRWRRRVGTARLVYVHTPEGKRHLLRAKERFLVSKYPVRTDSRLRWS
jgi:superfamily II DNA or RNA helicase